FGPATYPRVVVGRTSPALIFGLAPGGVCRASLSPGCWWALTLRTCVPHLFTLTWGNRSGLARRASEEIKTPSLAHRANPERFPRAVCFLLHFPYPSVAEAVTPLQPRTVGVTHHRVLWSPDFPLPGSPWCRSPLAFQAATVRPTCEPLHCTRCSGECSGQIR